MSADHESGLNVCGLVIHTNPRKTAAIKAALATMKGVDLHNEDDSRLIVTAIDTDESMAIDQMTAINRLEGVVSITLAYHEIERDAQNVSGHADGCGCA